MLSSISSFSITSQAGTSLVISPISEMKKPEAPRKNSKWRTEVIMPKLSDSRPVFLFRLSNQKDTRYIPSQTNRTLQITIYKGSSLCDLTGLFFFIYCLSIYDMYMSNMHTYTSVHICYDMCVVVRGQLSGVSSHPLPWVLESNSGSQDFYLLNHLTAPGVGLSQCPY